MNQQLTHALALYFADKNITNKVLQQKHTLVLKQSYHPTVALFLIRFNGHHKELYRLQKTILAVGHLLSIPRKVSRVEIDQYYITELIRSQVKGFSTNDIERIDVLQDSVNVYISRSSYFFRPTVIKIRRV